MEVSAAAHVRLNIGCGSKVIDGYMGVDIVPEAEIRADVMELPFADGTVDEVMGIHLFEHIQRWLAPAALAEWFRVLKPGGLLVLEMPCFSKVVAFMASNPDPRLGIWGAYGDPGYKNPHMVHKWLWSQQELGTELKAAGFIKIKEKPVQFHKPRRDMRIEARKP